MECETILDPGLLFSLMLTLALGFIAFLFLPSAIEISRPRFKEPRRILRTPLQRIMRYGSKPAFPSRRDSDDNTNASIDLEGFLKKAGVKSRRIDDNTVRIFQDVVFPPSFEVYENIIVEGALTAGDKCVFHRSVKAKRNVLIGCGVVMKENLISGRDVNIRDDSVVAGLVHAEGSVRLGEKVFIGLSVVANGDVELYENSEVKKNILTHGVIKVLKNPRVDFPTTLEDIG